MALEGKIPAKSFVGTLAVNVDNGKLSDAEFRQFVRNTLSSVRYDSKCKCGDGGSCRWLDDKEVGYWCDECWKKYLLSLLSPVDRSAIGRCVDHYPAKKIYRWVEQRNAEDPFKVTGHRLVRAPGGSVIEEGDLWR